MTLNHQFAGSLVPHFESQGTCVHRTGNACPGAQSFRVGTPSLMAQAGPLMFSLRLCLSPSFYDQTPILVGARLIGT